ncbi:major facilitator superfamily transporter [Xylariales sp. PMI_506]|nr:major facilitator superfamily transporter [Xylariales sp. PMI_506]
MSTSRLAASEAVLTSAAVPTDENSIDNQNDSSSLSKLTTEAEKPEAQAENKSIPEPVYLEGIPLYLVCLSLGLAVLCLALDRSIIATAIPKITSEFNSLDDVGWYGSAYLLTTCCFQLLYGKLCAEYKVNWVFLSALGLFEVGSLICGCAPNSVTLIVGRAVSGIGCAGLMSGALLILAQSLPLHKRPKYTGAISGAMGIAQVAGPTLGGVFTDRASWRWCFWINLPLGAVAAAGVLLFVKLPPKEKKAAEGKTVVTPLQSFKAFLGKVDTLGTVLFMPCMICFLLALQWGGTTYPWGNWRIILCFCLFGVLLVLWFYVQYKQGDKATLPLRIVRQRSIASGMWFMFCNSGAMIVTIYYIPIWFQAVKNASAEQSGVNFLASSGMQSLVVILSGSLTSYIGYYVPQMFLSATVVSIAGGLIYNYQVDTTTGYWVGTLLMFGFGVGAGFQVPIIAAQTVLKGKDMSLGTSVVILTQTLSGTIFVSVAETILESKLVQEVATFAPGVDPEVVVGNGASGISALIEKTYGEAAVAGVLKAYNAAIQYCFLLSCILSCLSVFGAVFMEWKNVKEEKLAKEHAKAAASAKQTTEV